MSIPTNLPKLAKGWRWATMSRQYSPAEAPDIDVNECPEGPSFRVRESFAVVDDNGNPKRAYRNWYVPGHVVQQVPTTTDTAQPLLDNGQTSKRHDPVAGEDFTHTGIVAVATDRVLHKAESGRGRVREALGENPDLSLDEAQALMFSKQERVRTVSEDQVAEAMEAGPDAVAALLASIGALRK